MTDGRFMGCEEALWHLYAYLDQQLSAAKRRKVEEHLAVCPSCSSKAEFEQRLKAYLRRLGRRPVRTALERRVKALLKRPPENRGDRPGRHKAATHRGAGVREGRPRGG